MGLLGVRGRIKQNLPDDFVTSMYNHFDSQVLVGWDMPEKLLGLQCCQCLVAEPWEGFQVGGPAV